jgi:hypothetical protein
MGSRGVLGALFGSVGLLQLGYCLVESGRAIASASWPTADGTVQSSYVREVTGTRIAPPPGWSGRTGHIPTVTYRYSVQGATYTGTRIWFTEFSAMPDEVRMTVAEFPVGTHVRVHFDAGDPQQSLLRPGLSEYSFLWLGLACLAIVVGAGLIWWDSKERRSTSAA